MKRSVTELQNIAASGGGLILDGSGYTTTELQNIASFAASGGARVVLRNMNDRPTTDLETISRFGKGAVQFEL